MNAVKISHPKYAGSFWVATRAIDMQDFLTWHGYEAGQLLFVDIFGERLLFPLSESEVEFKENFIKK